MNKIMTNEQKYKTPDERVKAFMDFYGEQKDGICKLCMFQKNGCIGSKVSRGFLCYQNWLALPCEEEKLESCPFCGDKGEVHLIEIKDPKENFVRCARCFYTSPHCDYANEAVAAHNRVARAVRAAEKGEVK